MSMMWSRPRPQSAPTQTVRPGHGQELIARDPGAEGTPAPSVARVGGGRTAAGRRLIRVVLPDESRCSRCRAGSSSVVTVRNRSPYLTAETDGLRIRAVATGTEALPRLQDVIARHLVRFGQRDELVVTWQDA
jgi:hypothetical protein